MKKVLLGLLALSAVSMAVAPNLGDAATAGTNVFQTGQEGAISITGKITSEVPVVKYVVYASTDGTANKEDTLALKDFVLSQDASKAGFQGTNPKVYVKRVGGTAGAETYEDLIAGDDVKFKVTNPDLPNHPGFNVWAAAGGTLSFGATQMLAKTTLQSIVDTIPGTTIDAHGNIQKDTKIYLAPKLISFVMNTNGIIETVDPADSNFGGPESMNPTDIATVEVAFAGGKAISNAKILVKVD